MKFLMPTKKTIVSYLLGIVLLALIIGLYYTYSKREGLKVDPENIDNIKNIFRGKTQIVTDRNKCDRDCTDPYRIFPGSQPNTWECRPYKDGSCLSDFAKGSKIYQPYTADSCSMCDSYSTEKCEPVNKSQPNGMVTCTPYKNGYSKPQSKQKNQNRYTGQYKVFGRTENCDQKCLGFGGVWDYWTNTSVCYPLSYGQCEGDKGYVKNK